MSPDIRMDLPPLVVVKMAAWAGVRAQVASAPAAIRRRTRDVYVVMGAAPVGVGFLLVQWLPVGPRACRRARAMHLDAPGPVFIHAEPGHLLRRGDGHL